MRGTSMATPHVTGLTALALTASPTATPYQLRQAILKQAVKTDGMGADDRSTSYGMGRASASGVALEATQAPGLKITSPRIFTSASSQTVQFRIEARGEDVAWTMRAIPYSGLGNVNLSGGAAVGSGGTVTAGNSASLSQNWTAAGSGTFIIVVEAVAGGRVYRDSTALRAP
jgi:subtilisin family serine protease